MDQMDINKLWQNFVDTITNHYNDSAGRIGRAQFWYFVLVWVLVSIAVGIVSGVLWFFGPPLMAVYSVALLLPTVGITARRLQDTGKAGSLAWLLAIPVASSVLSAIVWLMAFATFGLSFLFLSPLVALLGFAGLIGGLVLIYLCAQPGEAAANAHGPVPAPWTPGGAPKPTSSA